MHVAENINILYGLILGLMLLCVFLILSKRKLKKSSNQISTDKNDLNEKVSLLSQESELKGSLIDIFDNISKPIWVFSANGNIIYCNSAYADLVEEDEEEIFAKKINLCNEYKVEDKPVRTHIISHGKRNFYELTKSKKGEFFIGIAQDVTEVERELANLKYNMAVQNDLLDSSASGIAIYDSNQNLTYNNSSFTKLFSLDDSFLNRNPAFGEVLENLRTKSMLPEQANFGQFKQEALEMFENLIGKHEEFYYLPDGRVLRIIVLPHQSGGLLFSYEDMTNQITLEQSYNTLLSVQKSTIDNLAEGVAVIGEDGRLQFANPTFRKMWGFEREFLDSKPHVNEVSEQARDKFKSDKDYIISNNIIMKSISEHTPATGSVRLADGSLYEWAAIPLPDGAILLTFVDLTDSAMLEQALRAEKKALEDVHKVKINFLTNVSNELRSPLTSIKGFSELLKANYFGDLNEKQGEYVEDIYQSSLRLASMIDDILDVTYLEAGSLLYEEYDFSASKVFEKVFARTEERAEESKINLTRNKFTENVVLNGDQKHYKQALNSFFVYALKLVPHKGKMDIGQSIDDEKYHISIKLDYSQGDLSRLSELKHFNDEDFMGSDLNLIIAKKFIEIHKGVLQVDEEKDGMLELGLSFIVNEHQKLLEFEKDQG